MSDSAIVNDYLHHYDNRHIQVRVDFLGICVYDPCLFNTRRNSKGKIIKDEPNQECMAKIIRLVETLTDDRRKEWYMRVQSMKAQGLHSPPEPAEYPIELSYEAICKLLYYTFGESIVRNSIAVLLQWGYLKRYQAAANSIPSYVLCKEKVQQALDQQAQDMLISQVLKVTPARKRRMKKASGVESNTQEPESNTQEPESNTQEPESNTNNIYSNITNKSYKKGDTYVVTAHADDDDTPFSCFLCSESEDLAACDTCKTLLCFEHRRDFPQEGKPTEIFCLPCLNNHTRQIQKTAQEQPHIEYRENAPQSPTEPRTEQNTVELAPPSKIEVQREISASVPVHDDSSKQVGGPIADTTTRPTSEKPGRKQVSKVEKPAGPPMMPPADMEWCTRKCLQKFDAKRGAPLMVKYQLQQASATAKALAENYTEEQVERATKAMDDDPFYADRGGADILDVGKHIAKYLKRLERTTKPAGPPTPPTKDIVETSASLAEAKARAAIKNKQQLEKLRARAARLQGAS